MISRKLVRTDLNLLVVMQILLEEKNVTRAAKRLNVSQPALSKTLQKLREVFEDELFTRTAHGLVPTPRAEMLSRDLPPLLEHVDDILGSEDFSPATFEGSFTILLPPLLSESLLPPLMAELHREAPGVKVVTGEVTPLYPEQLKKAEADFAVFVAAEFDQDLLADPIPVVAPRCYMRRDHPLAQKEYRVEDFLAYPHLRLYLPGLTARERTSMVDEVLHAHGEERSITLDTTQFAAAVGVLVRTNALLVANAGFEEAGLYNGLITGRELPLGFREMLSNMPARKRGRTSLMRHTRTTQSEPHRWFRELLLSHFNSAPRAEPD